MEIISLLKAERDKAAQQVNALDTAIRAQIYLTDQCPFQPVRSA